MFLAFLSSRIRTWVLFAVLLPVAGRLLEGLGMRARNPRLSSALTSAGGFARRPTPGMRRAYRRRR